MSLWLILGIWVALSFAVTPLVGYYLSGAPQRAAQRKAHKELAARVEHHP
ncbi:uncharacterized protein YneF (UPF0154 family) [Rhizomicrobium palustre]|uniref:Uncharacterized protein YneF (UPF0154 family) n=1 Tax=Rhizomicrobium palustre TaxID=189966 RepID=A0A846MU48_9PROT|nr:hypothetical protein [Rhizomicrobium palustre]NIK86731.1 uncharacterized protein YneF (UPF0154 family) [Rhizomicrobium palustre]